MVVVWVLLGTFAVAFSLLELWARETNRRHR